MTPLRSALIACVLAALAPRSAHASLWVSAAGDDANPGTEEAPLRTLARARDVVRTLNRSMSDDITVFISGTHALPRPLELGPADGGTNGFSVVYTAAPGGHPVLSGGVRVRGWKASDAARNVWSAPAPEGLVDARQLFVNGARARRTRTRLFTPEPGTGGDASKPDPWALWKNPADVELVNDNADAIWSERTGRAPFYAENALELLGSPGEWYFDRPAHRLYYIPRGGEYLDTADVEAASAEALVVSAGTAERPLTGLIFKGIRFEYTAPGAGSRPPLAAVRIASSGNVQFLEDEFVHLGTPALCLGPAIDEAIVEGCLFGDISGPALEVADATDVRVANSRFSYVWSRGAADAAIQVSRADKVSVEHCQIDHFTDFALAWTDCPPGAVADEMNRVSPPIVGRDTRAPAAPGAGIAAAYEGLLDEQLNAPAQADPPTEVSAEAEDGFAYVTWTPPANDGGPPISAYTVSCSTGAKRSVSAAEFAAKGYARFDGLEDDTDGVTFTVTATNDLGPSAPSLTSAPVVPKHKRRLRPPPPPASLTVSVGERGPWLKITPPASTGGSPITAYTLHVLPGGETLVFEGWDVIHGDAQHRIERAWEGTRPARGTMMSVTATNVAGEGKPATISWP